jgi:hypothetical protein
MYLCPPPPPVTGWPSYTPNQRVPFSLLGYKYSNLPLHWEMFELLN